MRKGNARRGEPILTNYVKSLARHHKRDIDPDIIEDLTSKVPVAANWLSSVDNYRPVFGELTKTFDDSQEVETPKDVAYDLRRQALGRLNSDRGRELDDSKVGDNHAGLACERFLDSEIIAVYW